MMHGDGDMSELEEEERSHAMAAQTFRDSGSDGGPARVYSVEEVVDELGFGRFQAKMMLLSGLCWMADAMELMVLSILSPAIRCEWALTREQEAMISTFVFLGMLVGASLWGWIGDKYGRRMGYLCTGVFTLVFGIASAFAPSFEWLLLLRFMVGVGAAGAHVAFTLFAEFLPASKRGRYLVAIEIFWTVGTIFESGIAALVMPTLGWRWLLIFSAVPLLILCLLYPVLPESPRYLLARGDLEGAKRVLDQAAEANGVQLSEGWTLGVSESAATQDGHEVGDVRELFKPGVRKNTLLLWFLWFANSFVYYGSVLMVNELLIEERAGNRCPEYGVEPLVRSGVQACSLPVEDYIEVLVTSAAEAPGLIFTVLFIDRLGRKKTLSLEFMIAGLMCFLLIPCFGRPTEAVFSFVLRAMIAGGFQATYVLTPESFPTRVRSTALGTCSSLSRVGGMVTPYVAQVLVRDGTGVPLGIYGAASVVSSLLALMLRETAGKDMDDEEPEGAGGDNALSALGGTKNSYQTVE